MFHRIEIAIIYMPSIIDLITNGVLPEPGLPDILHLQRLRKTLFYHSPALREITIARRQRPDTVHMFGEHNPGINGKRLGTLGVGYGSL